MLPSEIPRLTLDAPVRVFPDIWKLLSFLRLSSLDGSPSLPLLFSFYLLYFFIPPFEDNGLPFWVPDVLCQHSEILWNYSAFKCSFDEFVGEKVVSLTYLCHLRPPSKNILKIILTFKNCIQRIHPCVSRYF